MRGLTRKKWYNSYKYSDKWTKIGVTIGIWLDNSHGNFKLHRFTTSENITKSFRGATFLIHTVYTKAYIQTYTVLLLLAHNALWIHEAEIYFPNTLIIQQERTKLQKSFTPNNRRSWLGALRGKQFLPKLTQWYNNHIFQNTSEISF